MPNQRKQGKVNIGGYFEEALVEEIKRIAQERGISVSSLVEELLKSAVEHYRQMHPRWRNAH